jgi:site-specific recombinase XerD
MTSALVDTRTQALNDVAELLPEFKVMLQATNRSPATITAYMAGAETLQAFLAEQGMPTAVDAVAREHVEAFYAWMLEAGYAPASVKNRRVVPSLDVARPHD